MGGRVLVWDLHFERFKGWEFRGSHFIILKRFCLAPSKARRILLGVSFTSLLCHLLHWVAYVTFLLIYSFCVLLVGHFSIMSPWEMEHGRYIFSWVMHAWKLFYSPFAFDWHGYRITSELRFPWDCESCHLLAFSVTIESPKQSDYQPFIGTLFVSRSWSDCFLASSN